MTTRPRKAKPRNAWRISPPSSRTRNLRRSEKARFVEIIKADRYNDNATGASDTGDDRLDDQPRPLRPRFAAVNAGFGAPLGRQPAYALIDGIVKAQQVA